MITVFLCDICNIKDSIHFVVLDTWRIQLWAKIGFFSIIGLIRLWAADFFISYLEKIVFGCFFSGINKIFRKNDENISWYITKIMRALFLIFKGPKRVDTKVLPIPQSGFGKHFHTVKGCLMTVFLSEPSDMKDSILFDLLNTWRIQIRAKIG